MTRSKVMAPHDDAFASAGRAGLTVLLGSLGGFGFALLLTPVVSRLYQPSVFGVFAAVTAAAAIFVGLSTFRLEVLAQKGHDEDEAAALRRLALVTALGWGVMVSLASAVIVLVTDASAYLLASGPLVVIASLQLIGSARLTRARQYRQLGATYLVQGAGTAVLQIALGWAAGVAGSLLAGFAVARLAWLPTVVGRGDTEQTRHSPVHRLAPLWRRSRRYAAVSGCAAALNSVGTQLPVLLCSLLFGQAAVGYLAMAIRLLVAPMAIVGQAAAAASIGEVGRLLREQNPAAHILVRRGMLYLLMVGAIPCAVAAVVGPRLAPIFLGQEWAATGYLLPWLAVGTLAQFAVTPFSTLLGLTGHQGWMLRWDACRVLLIAMSFGLAAALHQPLEVAVAAYSGCSVVLYIFLGLSCARAVNSPR